jgi:two-component system invasion response regulator UvrY
VADGRVPVLVVDDHDDFRALICEVVLATPGMTLAGQAKSGEEALDSVTDLSPRLVIMDKRMPGMGGIEAARRMHTRHPGVVVVLVSVEPPDLGVVEATGAAAFLHKRSISPGALAGLWQRHGG